MAAPSTDKWIIGTVAALGFIFSLLQFVWNSSRTDVVQLESRVDRGLNFVQRQFDELRVADKDHASDLKEQINIRSLIIDKIIDKNSNSIAELLVKKDVFDRYIVDQQERDRLAREGFEREITMLRSAIQMQRTELNALRDKMLPQK